LRPVGTDTQEKPNAGEISEFRALLGLIPCSRAFLSELIVWKGSYFVIDKIKILFLAANPDDVTFRLDLDREVEQIDAKIRNGLGRDSFELNTEWCVKPDVLLDVLQRHKPHILHFSGHGTNGRGIALEDDDGNTVLVTKDAFARLLKLLKDNLRIVVLNACHTGDQAKLLKETIDYTIGMNRSVGDLAARTFAASFYQALANGRTVQEAFESGVIQLELKGISGSDIPELLIRRGVDPSRPFLDEVASREKSPPSRAPETKDPRPNGVGIVNERDVHIGHDQIGRQKNYYGDSVRATGERDR
jgi:hypothetical protein